MFFKIHLEENNEIVDNYINTLYESKGFMEVTIQDFPIRGKAVYLKIKTSRWRLKTDTNKIIHNDFHFVAEGAGFTRELSDFFKDSGLYKP